MSDILISSRLEILAAKARILAEKYKHNQLWTGDLARSLTELENEVVAIRRESGANNDGQW